MNQIKFRENGDKFWIGILHTDHESRERRDYEIPAGSSFLSGTREGDRLILEKAHTRGDAPARETRFQLFKALHEIADNRHLEIESDRVIPPSERRSFEEIIRGGHVRKDLPFGMHVIDSSRKVHDMDAPRPQMTRQVQVSLWSLADSLARALRDPQGGQPGDSSWTVSGVSYSSWSVSHPDLEILESGESPLILRIRKIKDGKWGVIGMNQMKNLLNSKILSIQKTPPNNTWDIDNISKTAAGYFQEQKQKIMDLKQTMTPSQPPGSTSAPAPQPGADMGGGGAMPMASRRRASATLRNLGRARKVAALLSREPWVRGAAVVNDRYGIAVRARAVGRPGPPTVAGVPVLWEGRRKTAGYFGTGYFVDPAGKIINVGENHTIYMMDNPELFGGSEDPDELVYDGWVRLRSMNGNVSIDARGGLNLTQLRSIQKFLREECRYSDPRVEAMLDEHHVYEFTCDDFQEIEDPREIKRGRKSSRKTAAMTDEERLDHEEHVRRVYQHLLEHKRAYSSVKYLAKVLDVDPHKLQRALGELIVQGKVDILSKRFRPVPPQNDTPERVSLTATTSKFRTDKGNWRHDDQLQTQSPPQFQIFDAPEEDRIDRGSRIMPDPTYPN